MAYDGQSAYSDFLSRGYWLDEDERMAGLAWQGSQGGNSLFGNSAINSAGVNTGTYNTLGDIVPHTQMDWYSEAAAGRPVIGASVTPGMTPTQYNQVNPTAPTSVTTPIQWNQQPSPIQQTPAFSVGTGNQNLGSLPSSLSAPSQYSGGGTISSFWDQVNQGTGMDGSGLEGMFSDWFKKTYGSNFGM